MLSPAISQSRPSQKHLLGPRQHSDYLTARAANPRTGLITPDANLAAPQMTAAATAVVTAVTTASSVSSRIPDPSEVAIKPSIAASIIPIRPDTTPSHTSPSIMNATEQTSSKAGDTSRSMFRAIKSAVKASTSSNSKNSSNEPAPFTIDAHGQLLRRTPRTLDDALAPFPQNVYPDVSPGSGQGNYRRNGRASVGEERPSGELLRQADINDMRGTLRRRFGSTDVTRRSSDDSNHGGATHVVAHILPRINPQESSQMDEVGREPLRPAACTSRQRLRTHHSAPASPRTSQPPSYAFATAVQNQLRTVRPTPSITPAAAPPLNPISNTATASIPTSPPSSALERSWTVIGRSWASIARQSRLAAADLRRLPTVRLVPPVLAAIPKNQRHLGSAPEEANAAAAESIPATSPDASFTAITPLDVLFYRLVALAISSIGSIFLSSRCLRTLLDTSAPPEERMQQMALLLGTVGRGAAFLVVLLCVGHALAAILEVLHLVFWPVRIVLGPVGWLLVRAS